MNDFGGEKKGKEKDEMLHLVDPENKLKLDEFTEKTTIHFINPLREGKKLLVLDLDYTLFDCKSSANSISELMRPGMHEFLVKSFSNMTTTNDI